MKKIILLLSIGAINYISFGQRIDIGIKGGVNFSKLEILISTHQIKQDITWVHIHFSNLLRWYSA
jgi:hypothetical protein